ncbi:MAG: hypothetical protein ACI9UA_001465 [Pseudoalteromonas tetraodonis]
MTIESREICDDRWRRDLEWAVTSPFLVDFPHAHPQLDLSEIELPITRFTGHRVGYYFESLIAFWLENVRHIDMIAKGHQIIEDGKTLGELDFVFRDENGTINHWEVAAKFYLYCADHQFAGSHFIGPNAGDTFERKRDKIFERQLPLSESHFPEVAVRSAFVKGRIFYHPNQKPPDQLPDSLSENQLRGTWLRQSETAWLESLGDTNFRIARKPFWLAAGGTGYELSLDDLRICLERHFSSTSHPILFSAGGAGGAGGKQQMIFVVPDSWPNFDAARAHQSL